MGKELGFVLSLSLEEMALRKTVVLLWSEADILAMIEDIQFKEHSDKATLWKRVKNMVRVQASKLGLPETVKPRMNLVVKLIGLEIAKWLKFMKQGDFDPSEKLERHVLKQLCWTSAGALNYGKTARKLVSLDTLDVVKRFKIACNYCLVDSLPVVWEELPEIYKKDYKNVASKILLDPLESLFSCRNTLLLVYWTCVLTGEGYKLREIHYNFYMNAFLSMAKRGNKSAAEYFFQKLTNEERDSFLFSQYHKVLGRSFSSFPQSDFADEKCTDIVSYLFSQMTPQQEMHIFRNHPALIFRAFLQWPWQDLFLDKTDLIWTFTSEGGAYHKLLLHIHRKIYSSDHYFPELLREFFRRSPGNFRKSFVNEAILSPSLFKQLLIKRDHETVRVILRNIDEEDRVRAISYIMRYSCSSMVILNYLLVELRIREAYPSKEDRERLRGMYMRLLTENAGYEEEDEGNWQRFFDFLDETDARVLKKRKSGDETPTSVKNLHPEEEKSVLQNS